MGLDVYLYRCSDRAAAKAAEKQGEKETEGFWKKFCDIDGNWDYIAERCSG